MVEDRITHSKRVAEFLASELTGLEVGVLSDVAVVDADGDAEPSEGGTFAYRLDYRDELVASVSLHPEHVAIDFGTATIDPEEIDLADDEATLRVESGADVKRAVDAIRHTLDGT